MQGYTLRVGDETYRLIGTQLDVVRFSARMAAAWHRGEPITVPTVDGNVVLDPPEDLRNSTISIDGPWRQVGDDNPWATPG